jgi:hypothetical protein
MPSPKKSHLRVTRAARRARSHPHCGGPDFAQARAVTTERRSDIREILGTNPHVLPEGVSTVDVATTCRSAVLMLLESAHVPWGKPELAEWLTGPYRATTSFGTPREVAPPPSSARRGPIKEQRIDNVLREARAEAIDAFKRIAGPHPDLGFSYAVVYGSAVERCVDDTGATGWLPVDRDFMRLADRVLALIAVDYFVRPADYLCLLSVCQTCDRITFDARAKAKRSCPLHRTPQKPEKQRTA